MVLGRLGVHQAAGSRAGIGGADATDSRLLAGVVGGTISCRWGISRGWARPGARPNSGSRRPIRWTGPTTTGRSTRPGPRPTTASWSRTVTSTPARWPSSSAGGSRRESGPVLDVGCGTGIVGTELRRLGVPVIDGLDISPEMMAKAQHREPAPDGRARLPAPHRGRPDRATRHPRRTATPGSSAPAPSPTAHVGPDGMAELLRIARPGAACSIGINAAHFEGHGFREHLDRYSADGVVDGPGDWCCGPCTRTPTAASSIT